MKVTLKSILVLSTVALLVSSCKSREEKALETIKADMYKTLNDFDSYQPIETVFDSLENNVYGDTTNIERVRKIAELGHKGDLIYEEYQEALGKLDYWAKYKHLDLGKEKMTEYKEKVDEYNELLQAYEGPFKTELTKFYNGNLKKKGEFYGWRVTHKFRAKTKSGESSIFTFTYLMDKECEKIYTYFDETDSWEDYITYVNKLLEAK
jgi:hypothetical protein